MRNEQAEVMSKKKLGPPKIRRHMWEDNSKMGFME